MSNGRHFSPPTPAYRPRDPFANFEPRSAERVPSAENSKPPPYRARPVRMDGSGTIAPVVPMSLKVDPATVAPSAETVVAETARPEPQKADGRGPTTARPKAPEAASAEARRGSAPAADKPEAHKPPPPPAPAEKAEGAAPPKAESLKADRAETAKPAEESDKKKARQAEPEPAKDKTAAKKPSRSKEEEPEAPKTRAKAAEPDKADKAESAPPAPAGGDEELVVGEGEEIRVCEWEKCGKRFVVKKSGRNVVRRFCSGTCRGRASEARTGKR